MFIINKDKNEAISINKRTFQELNFKERKHLQEWISKNPSILGEELLIIQKEFSGFDDTKERLDLLALDKYGNLVVIENKLDDSGRDVIWQALKYTSYCSSLTKVQIKEIYQKYLGDKEDAEQSLVDFFNIEDFEELELNNDDQRIILVAANFRKEITSTAIWLLDHNVKIKCIKVSAFDLEGKIILNSEQIIPTPDAEEYTIKLATKKQEEIQIKESKQNRHVVRVTFWNELLPIMNGRSDLFRNVSASKDNWIGCGSGISGVTYNFMISGNYAKVELYINRGEKEENARVFEQLYDKKNQIEEIFGSALNWENKEENVTRRVSYSLPNVSVFTNEDWPKMVEFLVENMIKLELSFRKAIGSLLKK